VCRFISTRAEILASRINRSAKLTAELIGCIEEILQQFALNDVRWRLATLMASETYNSKPAVGASVATAAIEAHGTSSQLAQRLVDAARHTTKLALSPLRISVSTTCHVSVYVYTLSSQLVQQLFGLLWTFAGPHLVTHSSSESRGPPDIESKLTLEQHTLPKIRAVAAKRSLLTSLLRSTGIIRGPSPAKTLEEDGHQFDRSAYWHPDQREVVVKRLPTGGR
jgi:hypothetical protein